MKPQFFLIIGVGLVCSLGVTCAYMMKTPQEEESIEELIKDELPEPEES